MPYLRGPFQGPRGPSPIPPDGIPLNAPYNMTFGPFDGIDLPVQYGLTSTVITFTRPDGALIQSTDLAIGNGYVFLSSGFSIIYWEFAPGVLNQSGTWQYSISDPSTGFIQSGQFQISIKSHHENVSKALPPMKIQAFDDSCSIYTLTSPSIFDTTPPATLTDNWVDMTVAVNDGSNAYALWCEDVNSFYSPDGGASFPFDGSRGGVEVVLPGQSPSTQIIRSFSPGVPNDNLFLSATSGAFSANGTILVPVSEFNPISARGGIPVYPRISKDFGQTWADVTGLPASTVDFTTLTWTRACLSQNAAVMYIHQYKHHVWKSVDGGATWIELTNSPTWATNPYNIITPGLSQNSLRLRCSADGNVIAGIGWDAQFWISKDGGTTWNHTDFAVVAGIPGTSIVSGDFGMAIDGSKFLVAMGIYFASGAVWSSDDAINWTEKTVKLPSVIRNRTGFSTTQQSPLQCFLSPNGDKAVVAYARNTADRSVLQTDASYTHGQSFVNQPVTVNLGASGGNLVSAHILPA